MKANVVTLFAGALFGFTLGWARLAEPETIHRMLRLMEPDVFLIMGSAIATATIGTRWLRRGQARAWIGGAPIQWRTLAPGRSHVVGSILFGLGWSISCTCPGPAAVRIGRGELSGLFTAAGLTIGIAMRDARPVRARAPVLSPATPESLPTVGL